MASHWYYAHGEHKLGPFSASQLKELAAAGKILKTDTVWMEGVEKGAPAGKVRYLFAAPPAELADVQATTPPEAVAPAMPFGGWPESVAAQTTRS
jgi:hypothetical protein